MDSDTPDSLHESGSQAALLLGLRVLSLLRFLGFGVLWEIFGGVRIGLLLFIWLSPLLCLLLVVFCSCLDLSSFSNHS